MGGYEFTTRRIMNTQTQTLSVEQHDAIVDHTTYPEDAELVTRSLNGDVTAFEEIVKEHQETVFRVAMRFVKNETDANDVAQDAFLNAFRKLHTWKGNAALGSWLYRITVNTALMRLRKSRRRGEVALEGINPAEQHETEYREFVNSWHPRGDEVVENKELREQIVAAVNELEPKYQTVFKMKEFEERSLLEIADELDLSVPAVKSRLHRARLHLRATLERYVHA